MKHTILLGLALGLIGILGCSLAVAGNKRVAEQPEAYKKSCSACHMPYPAELLPAASWERILSTLDTHFSRKVMLNAAMAEPVKSYLLENAADKTTAKLGRKAMEKIGNATPARISTIPYIVHKHRKLGKELTRPSVKGLYNCSACHQGAAQGDFDDDRVHIPQ